MTAVCSQKREFGAFQCRFPVLFRGQRKKCFVCPLKNKERSIQVFDFEKDQSALSFSEVFSALGIFKDLRIMFTDIPLYYQAHILYCAIVKVLHCRLTIKNTVVFAVMHVRAGVRKSK